MPPKTRFQPERKVRTEPLWICRSPSPTPSLDFSRGRGTEKIGNGRKTTKEDESMMFDPSFYLPTEEISFDTIGGYTSIKQQLMDDIIIPFRAINAERITHFASTAASLTLTKGALFWGSPGTGKTMMAKAVAYECGRDLPRTVPVFVISGAELLTKWIGESESRLREIFHAASEISPSIVFIDEMDGLVRTRSPSDNDHVNFNMISTLLTLLNGVEDRGPVFVIGTSNLKDSIDPAVLRSGRFDHKIYFPPPDAADRTLILQSLVRDWGSTLNEQDLVTLGATTQGFCGADLNALCLKAQNEALVRGRSDQVNYPQITQVILRDFYAALIKFELSKWDVSTSKRYNPLPPIVSPLLHGQLQTMLQTIVENYPVKTVSGVQQSVACSAAWLAFSHPAFLLDYDRAIFIHSANYDNDLLDFFVSALFYALSDKNSVASVDFRKRSYGEHLIPSELPSFLKRSKNILGLFRLDKACYDDSDSLIVHDNLAAVLSERIKWTAPFMVITSIYPPENYGNQLEHIFGSEMQTFRVDSPHYDDCKVFFSDLFLKETARVAANGEGIFTHEISKHRLGHLERTLNGLSKCMAGKSMGNLLTAHKRLSKALCKDRAFTVKTTFLEEANSLIEQYSEGFGPLVDCDADGSFSLESSVKMEVDERIRTNDRFNTNHILGHTKPVHLIFDREALFGDRSDYGAISDGGGPK